MVHALFADGSACEVRVEVDAGPEPKVFVLGQPSRELLLSAERGGNAAQLALRRRKVLARTYATFCELLTGTGATSTVLGESAGLAFALAFTAAALERERGKSLALAVAATGMVASGGADAVIQRVDSVGTKLRGALEILSPGGAVLYPAANGGDVTDEVREAARSKSVRLVPV